MPDFGTARCDFPGGSSEMLYQSIQKILALPNETRIFVGHDYKAPGRDEYAWETTVGEQKAKNIHIGAGKRDDNGDVYLKVPVNKLWPLIGTDNKNIFVCA